MFLAGCSSSSSPEGSASPDTSASKGTEAGSSATEAPADEPSETPTPEAADDAASFAAAVSGSVSSVEKTEDLTEDTDGNDLLGRPHGYTSATVLYDTGATCDNPGNDCGAVIEVFADAEDAQTRADYIDEVTSSLGSAFAEYDTVSGTALLRVSGHIKPSVAETYKVAFLGATSS